MAAAMRRAPHRVAKVSQLVCKAQGEIRRAPHLWAWPRSPATKRLSKVVNLSVHESMSLSLLSGQCGDLCYGTY
eukprot:619371-Amphidinium_carterae.1